MMSDGLGQEETRDSLKRHSLFHVLSNVLILRNTTPYLASSDRLALASTSHAFKRLIDTTPGVFRHLDLVHVKAAQEAVFPGSPGQETGSVEADITDEDFYVVPLRNLFLRLQQKSILRDVRTLILDGLSVTAKFCNEIIVDPSYNVQILSIRDVTNLNEGLLRGALKHACRPSRPPNTPRLRALYIFGSRDGAPGTQDHRDDWYQKKGKIISRTIPQAWAETLQDCQGVIAFDAVLCQGPGHFNSPAYGRFAMTNPQLPPWAIATIAVNTCVKCHTCPEGVTEFEKTDDRTKLPLLSPPPILSSSLRAATTPLNPAAGSSFVARCVSCLQGRYCRSCHKWWCETCQRFPTGLFLAGGGRPIGIGVGHMDGPKAPVHRSCFDCGFICDDCVERCHKFCVACRGEYCAIHNDGSTASLCDWCSSRGNLAAHRQASKMQAQHASHGHGQVQQAWMSWMRQQSGSASRPAKGRIEQQRYVLQNVRWYPARRS